MRYSLQMLDDRGGLEGGTCPNEAAVEGPAVLVI